MTERKTDAEHAAELRKQADDIAREKAARLPEKCEALSREEARRSLHELRVHQIELQLQNEELRRTQGELESSRLRYIDLYDLAPVAYCTISEKGLILEANLTAATLLSVARAALAKQPITRFILKEHQDTYYKHRKLLFETGAPQVCEIQMMRSDGSSFWAQLEAAAAQDTDGAPVCRAVMSDITERKRAEVERENLQIQLLQSQKLESIGRLAGGVAHEINNMLGVILGHAQMAMEQVDPERPLYIDLQKVQQAARRSADLTRKLLAFARGQMVAPVVLDLNETVEGMLRTLRRLVGEGISITWMPDANLWPVKVDPSQIHLILANLCSNARDAIAGAGHLSIDTENITFDEAYCANHAGFIPGDYVLLTVSDDGCGMDKETLGKLFEPFFTTREIGKGMGLGLAVIYGIVVQNSGFINVFSEPDQGTTFRIYLPRHADKGEQARMQGPLEPLMRGQETILLVDGEPTLLDLGKLMLEKMGYRVVTGRTPGEAIRLAREHTGEIHLLLTDAVMPEMNGRDMAKQLLSLYPNLKLLFMSGYTADIITDDGALEKGAHFIQKPFSVEELAAKIREVLDSGVAPNTQMTP